MSEPGASVELVAMSLAAVYVETLELTSFVSPAVILRDARDAVAALSPTLQARFAAATARAALDASSLVIALHAASLPTSDDDDDPDRAYCEEAQARLGELLSEPARGEIAWPRACLPPAPTPQETLFGWRHLLLETGCSMLAGNLGGGSLPPSVHAAMTLGLYGERLGWLDAYVLFLMAELRASEPLLEAFCAAAPRSTGWLGLDGTRLRRDLAAAGIRLARAFEAVRKPADNQSALARATARPRPADRPPGRAGHLEELALSLAARRRVPPPLLMPSASRVAARAEMPLPLAEVAVCTADERLQALLSLLSEPVAGDARWSSLAQAVTSALAAADLSGAGATLAAEHSALLTAPASPLPEEAASALLRVTGALAIVRELALGPAGAGLVYAETLQRLPSSHPIGRRLTLDLLDAYVRCGVVERETSALEYALRVADFCLDPANPELDARSRLIALTARARLLMASPDAPRDRRTDAAAKLESALEAAAEADPVTISQARETLGELQISWVGEPGGAKWLDKAVLSFRAAVAGHEGRPSRETAGLRRRLCDALTRQARVTRNATLAAEAVLEGTLGLLDHDREHGELAWAQLCFALGCAHQAATDLGSAQHEEALLAFDRARVIYDAYGLEDEWRDVQRRRGDLLLASGKRRKSLTRLNQAVVSREELMLAAGRDGTGPDALPAVKAKLAEALVAYADAGGPADALRVAADALRDAVDATPTDQAWPRAALQLSLGEALFTLGTREGTPEPLREGLRILDDALSVRTLDKHPLPWIATMNARCNIAVALAAQTGDTGLMSVALAAQKDAFDEATRRANSHYIYVVRRDLQRNREIEASMRSVSPAAATSGGGA